MGRSITKGLPDVTAGDLDGEYGDMRFPIFGMMNILIWRLY